MYEYRRMTPEQQRAVVEERKERGFPWHSPPHPEAPGEYRIVTGTCFEHTEVLNSLDRLAWFEEELLKTLQELNPVQHILPPEGGTPNVPCAAWCVLPNHYHVLVRVGSMRAFSRAVRQLHGRTSYRMNREDGTVGRQVWYRSQDRVMRSEAHFYTTINYIHNNPVKHGYVQKCQDWPFSSVHWYLATKGRDWLLDLWRSYPVRDYGAKWDDYRAPRLFVVPRSGGCAV